MGHPFLIYTIIADIVEYIKIYIIQKKSNPLDLAWDEIFAA